MSNQRNTTPVIAAAISDNHLGLQFGEVDVTITDLSRQIFTKDASFRDMRRAADRIGLSWEGTSNSNFRVRLTFAATDTPVYLPNGEVPESIQEAFSKVMGSANEQCYGELVYDSRFLRASLWVDRVSTWHLRYDVQCIEKAMVNYQKLVHRAVIRKQGWKIINTML